MSSWRSRAAAALLIASLVSPASAAPAAEQELARGISLVKSGDFEGAVTPLTSVVQDLTPDLRRREELSRAYLFLGVAYLELNRELEARGKFREALRNNPKLSLSPGEFSAQVMRVFETERAVLQPRKKKILLPLFLVLGGGAATAGVVAAAGSGGGSPTTTAGAASTTTTSPTGGGTTTTTTTTPGGGPTTTLPASTTTTTLPGSTTTTTTSTTSSTTSTTSTSTTSTTTTTTPPACTWALGPDKTVGLAGGTGVCNVTVNAQTCGWNVEVFPASASSWLTLTSPSGGTGSGSVGYSVALLLLGTRSAVIRAQQNPGTNCTITQKALLAAPPGGTVALQSRMELPGGRGQVVLNGGSAFFQQDATTARVEGAREGPNRIEGTVVTAGGRPGLWRFELSSGIEPGSLMVVAGQVRLVTGSSVVFQLTGKPGERVVFVFKGTATR